MSACPFSFRLYSVSFKAMTSRETKGKKKSAREAKVRIQGTRIFLDSLTSEGNLVYRRKMFPFFSRTRNPLRKVLGVGKEQEALLKSPRAQNRERTEHHPGLLLLWASGGLVWVPWPHPPPGCGGSETLHRLPPTGSPETTSPGAPPAGCAGDTP